VTHGDRVEVVDEHVKPDATGGKNVFGREGKMIMLGRGDGPYGASVTGQDAPAQQPMAGIVSAAEGHHDLGTDVVQLVRQRGQLSGIECQRLLHE